MSIGIIDVREWQTVVDFETGQKLEAENSLIDPLKKIISRRYYPGDMDEKGIQWVTDMALDLVDIYQPHFMFMNFAQPHFYSFFKPYMEDEWKGIVDNVFSNITRFLEKSDYTPVIVGLGDMTELKYFIDLSSLDCLAIATNWSFHYAGLFGPSKSDLKKVKDTPHIERVVSKQEIINEFGGTEVFIERLPEYLLVAEEGYTFKGFESTSRNINKIPAKNMYIPIHNPLGTCESIIDIRKTIQDALPDKKVALIIVEGIGEQDFMYPHTLCKNTSDWFIYENLMDQYMTITTGRSFQYNDFPPVYMYYEEDDETKKYPFSGAYTSLPQDTIGRLKNIKSAAVGTRGMVTHVASGADICIECFARQLYNFGTMAIINDSK